MDDDGPIESDPGDGSFDAFEPPEPLGPDASDAEHDWPPAPAGVGHEHDEADDPAAHDPADGGHPDHDDAGEADDDAVDPDDADALDRGPDTGEAPSPDDVDPLPFPDADDPGPGVDAGAWAHGSIDPVSLSGWLSEVDPGGDVADLLAALADPDGSAPEPHDVNVALEARGVDTHVAHLDTFDLSEVVGAGGSVWLSGNDEPLQLSVVDGEADQLVFSARGGAEFVVSMDDFEELWADNGNEALLAGDPDGVVRALVPVVLPPHVVPTSLGIR